MSKNVLILSSSPRKGGNSDMLCDEFFKGAEENGNKVEKIYLTDKKINYCKGCQVCYKNHVDCVQKDDMKEILDKMLKSDVIVLATPVYFYTMSAQMKTLIDRTVPKYEVMSNKEFYFLITAYDPDKKNLERTVESLRGFTSCLNNPIEKGIVYGVGAYEKGAIKDTPAFKQAYNMGKTV
jgi:multimeric flavodoxin WrbA